MRGWNQLFFHDSQSLEGFEAQHGTVITDRELWRMMLACGLWLMGQCPMRTVPLRKDWTLKLDPDCYSSFSTEILAPKTTLVSSDPH